MAKRQFLFKRSNNPPWHLNYKRRNVLVCLLAPFFLALDWPPGWHHLATFLQTTGEPTLGKETFHLEPLHSSERLISTCRRYVWGSWAQKNTRRRDIFSHQKSYWRPPRITNFYVPLSVRNGTEIMTHKAKGKKVCKTVCFLLLW